MPSQTSPTSNDPEKGDSYVLKLSGKAEAPRALSIAQNIHASFEGAITSETIVDNNDGSATHIYNFRPVKIELLDEMGKTLRLKDTRSSSQLFRARLWKAWQNAESNLSFDEWYARLMLKLIQNAEEIVEMYKL